MKTFFLIFFFISSSISIFSNNNSFKKNDIWVTVGSRSSFIVNSSIASCMPNIDCYDYDIDYPAFPVFTLKYSKYISEPLYFYIEVATIYQKFEVDHKEWNELYFSPQIGLIFGKNLYWGFSVGYPIVLDKGKLETFLTGIASILFGYKLSFDNIFISFDFKLGVLSISGGSQNDGGYEGSADIGIGFRF